MHNTENKAFVSDICARLPYGIKGKVGIEVSSGNYSVGSGHLEFNDVDVELLGYLDGDIVVQPIDEEYNEVISNNNFDMDDFVPYLRSISSMTEEERKEYMNENVLDNCDEMNNVQKHYKELKNCPKNQFDEYYHQYIQIPRVHAEDYLNSIHVDYRGLIDKGLALEAPEGMYKK